MTTKRRTGSSLKEANGAMPVKGFDIVEKKELIFSMILIIVILAIAIFILFSPKIYDIVEIPEEMDVSITKTSDGYEIIVLNEGDFTNGTTWGENAISTNAELKWKIWDSENIKEIDSGYFPSNSTKVQFNDSNFNHIVDTGDKFQILNVNHSYGGHFFILTLERKNYLVIHEKIPP